MPSVDVALRQADVGRQARAADAAGVEIARVEIFDDFAAAAPTWDRLAADAVATPFGRRDWIELWQRHIGARNGVVPAIVVARDADGAVLCILPLATRPAGIARELSWLGAELCDYNAPLLAPDFSARVDAAKFMMLWQRALELLQQHPRLRFDMVRLEKMPETIRGQQNPLLALPATLHPSGCYATPLAQSWDAFYAAKRSPSTRRRDRTKRNRLAELGEIEFATPATPSGALEALSVLVGKRLGGN